MVLCQIKGEEKTKVAQLLVDTPSYQQSTGKHFDTAEEQRTKSNTRLEEAQQALLQLRKLTAGYSFGHSNFA
jgi:hypothetical protein